MCLFHYKRRDNLSPGFGSDVRVRFSFVYVGISSENEFMKAGESGSGGAGKEAVGFGGRDFEV